MFSLFSVNASFFKSRIFMDTIYFLMLVAMVMALLNPQVLLLPALIMAVVYLLLAVAAYKTGFLAVVLAVRKNE